MSVLKSLAFDEICQRRAIRPRDVTQLRGLFLANDVIARDEIEGLLEINRACRIQDESWSEFLTEAVSDFVIHDLEPAGYLTTENANWLIHALAPDGRIGLANVLRLLRLILAKARWTPNLLIVFAIEQVRLAIETGDGPLRAGTVARSGEITDDDADFVASVFGTVPRDRPDLLGAAELEALIATDCIASRISTSWTELLQTLVAGAALQASGYPINGRYQLLNSVAWLSANPTALDYASDVLGIDCKLAQPTEADVSLVNRLERQRIEIITGEPIRNMSAETLAAILSTARPELSRGISVICTAGVALHPALDCGCR